MHRLASTLETFVAHLFSVKQEQVLQIHSIKVSLYYVILNMHLEKLFFGKNVISPIFTWKFLEIKAFDIIVSSYHGHPKKPFAKIASQTPKTHFLFSSLLSIWVMQLLGHATCLLNYHNKYLREGIYTLWPTFCFISS